MGKGLRSPRWGRWVEGSVYHVHWLPGRHLRADLATVEEVTVFARQQEESFHYELHMSYRLPGARQRDIVLGAPLTVRHGLGRARRRLARSLADALAAHPDHDLVGPSAADLRHLADATPDQISLWISNHDHSE